MNDFVSWDDFPFHSQYVSWKVSQSIHPNSMVPKKKNTNQPTRLFSCHFPWHFPWHFYGTQPTHGSNFLHVSTGPPNLCAEGFTSVLVARLSNSTATCSDEERKIPRDPTVAPVPEMCRVLHRKRGGKSHGKWPIYRWEMANS